MFLCACLNDSTSNDWFCAFIHTGVGIALITGGPITRMFVLFLVMALTDTRLHLQGTLMKPIWSLCCIPALSTYATSIVHQNEIDSKDNSYRTIWISPLQDGNTSTHLLQVHSPKTWMDDVAFINADMSASKYLSLYIHNIPYSPTSC